MKTIEELKKFLSDPEVMNLFDRDKLKEESAVLRGMERGKEEGIAENKLETAKNMLKENLSFEQISKITHLSNSEIKKLV